MQIDCLQLRYTFRYFWICYHQLKAIGSRSVLYFVSSEQDAGHAFAWHRKVSASYFVPLIFCFYELFTWITYWLARLLIRWGTSYGLVMLSQNHVIKILANSNILSYHTTLYLDIYGQDDRKSFISAEKKTFFKSKIAKKQFFYINQTKTNLSISRACSRGKFWAIIRLCTAMYMVRTA